MKKKTILFLCIILIFMSILSACGQDKVESKKDIGLEITPSLNSGDENLSNFYAFIMPGDEGEYLVDDVVLVYEEDEDSIIKYELLANDFFDGYAIVNEKEEWITFVANSSTVYKMLNYLDEKGELGIKGKVSEETFSDQFKHTQFGWLLAEISIKDDCIKEVKEADGSQVRLNYIKEKESVAENNGGHFVKYQDSIYYREYNDDSYEKSGLLYGFNFISGTKSKMMKLDSSGKPEKVFDDAGFNGIFIYEDSSGKPRLLLTGYNDDIEDDQIPYPDVYSVAFDGTDLIYYGSGSVFAVDEEKGLAIAGGYRGSISVINLESGERFDLAEAYYRPIYYDPYDEILYCEDGSGEISDADIVICSFRINDGVKTILYSATREDIDEMLDDDYSGDYFETISVKTSDKYMWLYLAGYGGNAYHYYNSALLKINKDGSGYELVGSPIEIDWFGDKKPFSYKEDTPFYVEKRGYYICGLKDKIYPDIVLTNDDFKKINLLDGEYYGTEDFVSIDNIEYVDNSIYFTVMTGTRNEEEDMGWRYGYNRNKSCIYRKDLKTQKIDLLYTY